MNPFTIRLERSGSVQFNNTNYDNKPIVKVIEAKVDEKQIKKDLKKEFKGIPWSKAEKLQF